MNDPMRFDNKGFLATANAAGLLFRMWDIYFGRLAELTKQINNFKKLLAGCEAKNGKR